MIEELEQRSLRGYVEPYYLALIYVGMGDREQALDELEQAYAAKCQWLTFLKVERIFDPLRSDPRFIELLKKVHLDK